MTASKPQGATDTEKLQRRNRELSIINDIAATLNREVDLIRALNAALERVVKLFDLQTGWVWLQRESTGETYLAAALNLPPALANDPASMEGSCHCLDTYQIGELDGATNISVITCTRLKELVTGTAGLRYHASIPLYNHDQKVGVLNVTATDWRELSDDDLRLLSTVGDLLSIAIERARLFDRSTQLGAVEERNRLARELHDTLAQSLAGIALQLETADALLDVDMDKTRQALQRALTLARNNLDEVRRSVLDLRAAPLEGRSLAEALTALIEDITRRHAFIVDLSVVGAGQPLPVRVEAGLYRIAQEALTNVIRHAEAYHLTISYTATPDHITLVIADDGRGFMPDSLPTGQFGLIGLNERVRLLNGKLDLQSEPGAGTRLQVVIPL